MADPVHSILPNLLSDIRAHAVPLAAQAWPELGSTLDGILPDPLDPFALLPVCTGVACGAQPDDLIPFAAAIVVTAAALRILDDSADQDNPFALYLEIGQGRATNAGAALVTVATRTITRMSLPANRKERLIDGFFDAFLTVCRGQDEELRGMVQTLDHYNRVVQQKTVTAIEFAATTGALAAGADDDFFARCKECGFHLGWMIQILDDIEALWFPDAASDIEIGRFTFPVLHGLQLENQHGPELRRLLAAATPSTRAICTTLDKMNVRSDLMGTALDHRDQALAALAPPLLSQGQEILQLWLDWLFRDGRRLLGLSVSLE